MSFEHADGAIKRQIAELQELHEIWLFLVAMGLVLVLVGCAAIGSCFVTASATVLVFAALILVGGLVQIVTAFWARRWHGFFLHLLSGSLLLFCGLFMVHNPLEAVVSLSFLVALCLLLGGIFRVVIALLERFDGWGLMLFNGVISILLGMAMWSQWPLSGIWVIGLFVGIEVLLSGLSWLILGLSVRASPSLV